MYIQMKNKFSATSSVALVGWACLIVISVGSIIRGCEFGKSSVINPAIIHSISDYFQQIYYAAENITNCVFDLTDTLFNFLYYDYCDFMLGLF